MKSRGARSLTITMRRTGITSFILVGLLAVCGSRAAASCRVTNDTKYAFTVASGNTSNQRVGAHTTTTIAAGKIQGKSDEGRTISGMCKDGGDLVIQEKNGVPLLMPRKR
jgi:hypothetical protein